MNFNPALRRFQIYFWLALLIHIILLASFTVSLSFHATKPELNLPIDTYIYQEEKNNPVQPHPALDNPSEEKEETSKIGLEKPNPKKLLTDKQTTAENMSVGKGEQNINLTLKTNNKMNKPLLNILTKAVAAHLTYPKIAIDFRLRGLVTLGFLLSPDGGISEIEVLKSSGTSVLDQAATSAIAASSPLKNIAPYLTKTEPFLFTIEFG